MYEIMSLYNARRLIYACIIKAAKLMYQLLTIIISESCIQRKG